MFDEEMDGVLLCALDTWGSGAQQAMLVGELGELLTLFGRAAQGRDTEEDWASEIADSLIMLRQIAFIKTSQAAVKAQVIRKMNRLRAKLERV